MTRATLRRWLLYALAWVPLFLLYLAALASEIPFTRALRGSALAVLVAALLGVGVWRLSAGLPWPRRGRVRFLAVHSAVAVAYVGLWLATIYARIALETDTGVAVELARSEGGWTLLMGVALYAIVAGVSYAIRGQAQASEQEQAAARAEALRARAEALRARAELRALRARLDPHFLFNTLHGMRSLVRRDPARAEEALESLGDLLRLLLDLEGDDADEIGLADELAIVRHYLALEQLRLGDRLRVVEEIDPIALGCLVPALLLQPLVENAVRYGVAVRSSGGTVRLVGQVTEGVLTLRVEDDGPGTSRENALSAPGLGLRTIRQRLDARYDGGATLDIATAPGQGFAVQLRLPAPAGA